LSFDENLELFVLDEKHQQKFEKILEKSLVQNDTVLDY
jgi:hypothetical protein